MLRTAVVVSIAAAAAVLAIELPAAAQTTRYQTLRLDSRFTYSKMIGRIELATDKLSIGKRVVGRDVVACTEVTSAKFECSFTETIDGKGTLQAEGFQGSTNAAVAMPIVGGTGVYVGATGTMTTSDELTKVEHYLLRYTLRTG